MAVSAAGIPILLQAASIPLQDLAAALSPGAVVNGRVVELLPQNQALISLRGQNVVAQLPPGSSLAKGDVLSLLVVQASAGDPSTATPASLLLKLLPATENGAQPSAQAPSPGTASSSGTPGFGPMEAALSAAKLPANSVNLALAQTLSRLGAPLDAPSLQALSRSVESLISNETTQTSRPGSALEDPSVRQSLQEGLAQVRVATQMSPSGEQALNLMQAARSLEEALQTGTAPSQEGPGSAAPASGKNWSSAIEQAVQNLLDSPTQALAQNLNAVLAQAAEAPGGASANAGPNKGIPAPASGTGAEGAQSGLAAAAPSEAGTGAGVLEASFSGSPNGAGATEQSALSALLGSETAGLGAAPGASAGATGTSGPAAPLAGLAMNSADIPSMREALAQWLGPMNQDAAPLNAGSLAAGAQALANSFTDASQGPTQRLIAAVQSQSPQSSPSAIQGAAARALQQVADFYGQLPGDRSVPGVQTVQADLKAQGLPVPTADLATLPPETVASAVAWLSARGLPAQRPLVETVAGWMNQDRSALPAAQRALQGQDKLTESLESRPTLKQAYEALSQAMDSAGLNPESDGLAGRLQSWASAQGLTLESDLAQPFGSLFEGGAAGAGTASTAGAPARDTAAGAAVPGNSLRGALLHLENELSTALQSTQPAAGSNAEGLNSALRDAQAAVRSFNALPLQAQGAPSFDTVHLPLPVWMNGAMGEGRLSVTWRQGRERELDDKDPVNVAVSLNTESLGPVTVTLQVWKNSASARVIAADRETAAFMAQGADDLRSDFSENTPFALQSLEFSTAAASVPAQSSGPEAPSLGLSLSA
ncbi:MAG TPA: flagellar hook-length control protein FliK [bacterium]|nr:flagellar hook-length control protein FliK [bacterium]